jgi:CspA family cold shock protein
MRKIMQQQNAQVRQRGTVKRFNALKGYGFIGSSDGGPDVFVHISAVERAGLADLREGQRITFTLQTRRDGRVAAADIEVD